MGGAAFEADFAGGATGFVEGDGFTGEATCAARDGVDDFAVLPVEVT